MYSMGTAARLYIVWWLVHQYCCFYTPLISLLRFTWNQLPACLWNGCCLTIILSCTNVSIDTRGTAFLHTNINQFLGSSLLMRMFSSPLKSETSLWWETYGWKLYLGVHRMVWVRINSAYEQLHRSICDEVGWLLALEVGPCVDEVEIWLFGHVCPVCWSCAFKLVESFARHLIPKSFTTGHWMF